MPVLRIQPWPEKCLSEISGGTRRKNALKKIVMIFGIIILLSGAVIAVFKLWDINPMNLTDLFKPKTVLHLRTTPPGAQVFIDDELKNRTPLDITLPLGDHDVRFSLTGHYPWEATVKLDKKDETIKIDLEPKEKKEP